MPLPATFALLATLGSTPADAPDLLLACGGREVRLYDVRSGREAWRWTAAAADESQPGALDKIDDCKPTSDGRVLVTASTGGVAVLDRTAGRVGFRAFQFMAHSAAMLPGARVVVAASVAPDGDRLAVYDLSDGAKPVFETPLPAAHGVVWRASEGALYALGRSELRRYRPVGWDGAAPGLELVDTWPLPGTQPDGHDLSLTADGGGLIMSQTGGVWRFDLATRMFAPFTAFAGRTDLKSISQNRITGRFAFTHADISWWSHTIRLLGPDRTVPVGEGLNLYKVRWLSNVEQAPAQTK